MFDDEFDDDYDGDFDGVAEFAPTRIEQQSVHNEIHIGEGVTVLLGLKPFDVPRPASIKQEAIIETVLDDRYSFPHPISSHVTANAYQLMSQGKLLAITNRFNIKKDLETGHITLRLFKNRTTLY